MKNCILIQNKNKTKIVCLCGSTRFKKEFEKAIRLELLKGNIVLSVAQFSHYDNLTLTENEKKIFDTLHMKKIEISDDILVINVNGYIGKSTLNEINYAKKLNKKIRYFDNNEKIVKFFKNYIKVN